MSQDLAKASCVPCRGGQPTLSDTEIARLRPAIPQWTTVEKNGVKRLERVFKFKDFAQALAFMVKLGQLAESEGHHPSILAEWEE